MSIGLTDIAFELRAAWHNHHELDAISVHDNEADMQAGRLLEKIYSLEELACHYRPMDAAEALVSLTLASALAGAADGEGEHASRDFRRIERMVDSGIPVVAKALNLDPTAIIGDAYAAPRRKAANAQGPEGDAELVRLWKARDAHMRAKHDDPEWAAGGDPSEAWSDRLTEIDEAIIATKAVTALGLKVKAALVAAIALPVTWTADYEPEQGAMDDRAILSLVADIKPMAGEVEPVERDEGGAS